MKNNNPTLLKYGVYAFPIRGDTVWTLMPDKSTISEGIVIGILFSTDDFYYDIELSTKYGPNKLTSLEEYPGSQVFKSQEEAENYRKS